MGVLFVRSKRAEGGAREGKPRGEGREGVCNHQSDPHPVKRLTPRSQTSLQPPSDTKAAGLGCHGGFN